jgi:hypothetical protein
MTRRLRLAAGLVAAVLAIAAVATVSANQGSQRLDLGRAVDTANAAKPNAAAFRTDMRKLWEDHITWTRQYIVSAATLPGDLPDIGPTADRLFANQVDIGNAIKPFYGDAAGNRLTQLLTDHIAIAADAIAKAKAGDSAGLNAALDAWHANADAIARFLADANPRSWPFVMMQAHMRDHLDLTLAEAVARLQGRYADDIAAYDQVHAQILEMADMLSDGIIAQFAQRFTGK